MWVRLVRKKRVRCVWIRVRMHTHTHKQADETITVHHVCLCNWHVCVCECATRNNIAKSMYERYNIYFYIAILSIRCALIKITMYNIFFPGVLIVIIIDQISQAAFPTFTPNVNETAQMEWIWMEFERGSFERENCLSFSILCRMNAVLTERTLRIVYICVCVFECEEWSTWNLSTSKSYFE